MMQIRGPSNIQATRQIDFANTSKAVDNSPSVQVDTADQVDLSSEAQLIANMNDIEGTRAAHVASIRQQIETGQYETAAKLDVAVERLLDEMG